MFTTELSKTWSTTLAIIIPAVENRTVYSGMRERPDVLCAA